MVQFIGGEPTLHPDLPALVGHALAAGLEVEVFSNLVHVGPAMWEVFARPGVRLACSYYSDDAAQHAAVTGRAASHERTRGNIVEAIARAIPLRVGVIDVADGQRVDAAVAELTALGVVDVGVDRLRQVGRGVRDSQPSMDELCGNCAAGVLAVAPDGTVWPCVFTRWLSVGSVHTDSLSAILTGEGVSQVRSDLADHLAAPVARCSPDDRNAKCGPSCNPNCNPGCTPCSPRCKPSCHPSCGPACQPNCSPGCSPTCGPSRCKPRGCWPAFS